MLISVIIPVYNEEKYIRTILDKVNSVSLNKEIIVVDDSSTDKSFGILKQLEKEYSFKLIKHDKNQGKGAAIRTALKYVTGDIIIIQDADLEYDPNDYYALVEPIVTGQSKIVYGSRLLVSNKIPNKIRYISCYVGTRCLTLLTNILFRSNITDINTGYKIFHKSVLENITLESNGFEFCEEVTVKCLKQHYKIIEVPIHYYPRSVKEGKKLKFPDALIALWTIIKYFFF